MAAANTSSNGRMARRGETSVVVSPLLNLAPSPATATLNHHRPLRPLRGGGLTGGALLSLSPDRRTLDVKVLLDRPRPATISLRQVERLGGQRQDEDLLIIEIATSGAVGDPPCAARRFSLERREAFELFAETCELLGAGIRLSELRAGSVSGVDLEPARSDRRSGGEPKDYLSERMLIEIAAAEHSATAIAARRHVELAILYARELGAGARVR